MAIQTNPIFDGYRGSVNQQLLFRQCWGRTVVSKWPDRSKVVYSTLQLDERKRFRDAVSFARVVVNLPLLKAQYTVMAHKLGFRSAWNAAIAEYMSKTELKQKPKKVWFDTKIIKSELGEGYHIKLYKLVYPDVESQIAEIRPSIVFKKPKIVAMWPLLKPRSGTYEVSGSATSATSTQIAN